MAFDFVAREAKVIIWDINGDAIKTAEDEGGKRRFYLRHDLLGITTP
jgi:hypothetical protein